ncbi:MAG TPA: hypothetical protein VGF13_02450 [Verrucomicrobiae bacterium]|jgi:hypothetical protein
MNVTYDSTFTWDQPGIVWADFPEAPATKKIMQDIFALKLREKDAGATAQLSVDMEQGLATTGHVATPSPTVAALAAKRTAIGTKLGQVAAAESALQMKVDELETLRLELGELLTDSARDSQRVVNADRMKMTELKIPLRATGQAASDNPLPIVGLVVTDGDMSGESDWSWPARRPGRPLYILETAASAAGPYTPVYTGLKSRHTTHTAAGAELWARVTVEQNGFRSDPSQPVSFRPH